MTYNHEKKPWMIAHRMDLFTLHEIAMARAVPNPIPILVTSEERCLIRKLLFYSSSEESWKGHLFPMCINILKKRLYPLTQTRQQINPALAGLPLA